MNNTNISTFGPNLVIQRFELTFADFQAGTLTSTNHISTVNLLLPLALGSLVLFVRIKSVVAFAGGSVSAATVSVGSVGASSATTFATAYDVYQAVADTTFKAGPAAALMGTYAADTMTAVLTLTSDVLANLTAGDVFIDVVLCPWTNLVGTGPVGNPPFSTTGGGYYGT
jgi:hypothetical protein